MIAGRHKDGRIVLMAHEEGLPPLVQSSDGSWSIEAPDPDELSEFSAITDSRARRRLVEAARSFMKSEAAKDRPTRETRPTVPLVARAAGARR
jgi:hypothetical protein